MIIYSPSSPYSPFLISSYSPRESSKKENMKNMEKKTEKKSIIRFNMNKNNQIRTNMNKKHIVTTNNYIQSSNNNQIRTNIIRFNVVTTNKDIHSCNNINRSPVLSYLMTHDAKFRPNNTKESIMLEIASKEPTKPKELVDSVYNVDFVDRNIAKSTKKSHTSPYFSSFTPPYHINIRWHGMLPQICNKKTIIYTKSSLARLCRGSLKVIIYKQTHQRNKTQAFRGVN
jgi:hypothetical protein